MIHSPWPNKRIIIENTPKIKERRTEKKTTEKELRIIEEILIPFVLMFGQSEQKTKKELKQIWWTIWKKLFRFCPFRNYSYNKVDQYWVTMRNNKMMVAFFFFSLLFFLFFQCFICCLSKWFVRWQCEQRALTPRIHRKYVQIPLLAFFPGASSVQ